MFASLVLASAISAPINDDLDAQAAMLLARACISKQKQAKYEVLVPPVQKSPPFREATGHTHTCANGHTWDHTTNPTHTCQICGLSQYVVDSVPKAVTASSPFMTLGSGCANGNCPAPATYTRPKLFGRR